MSLIRGSKAWGRIYSGFNSASLTREAMAYAAAIFIFSVMAAARTSSAPRKIPGNATTLLIWLGKSLRPVAMTRTPPALASSGMISGVGLAMAKTMASLFMVLHSSVVRMPGRDTPMKTSAPSMASFRPPLIWRGLVTSPSQFLWASALLQPLYRVPN